MSETLTIGAALLLGLAASGHCLLMCGGITAALGMATSTRPGGTARAVLLAGYQLGRIASYAAAGFVLAGALGFIVRGLDAGLVSATLRALTAAALLVGALVVLGRLRDPGHGFGQRLWRRLAPLGRRLLPVTTLPRALAFGAIWGWMPCGFVYTVLLVAALQGDAWHGAATMLAFGLGTLPAMLAASYGAGRIAGAARPSTRRLAGAALVASAALTLAGPWWMPEHHAGHGDHDTHAQHALPETAGRR